MTNSVLIRASRTFSKRGKMRDLEGSDSSLGFLKMGSTEEDFEPVKTQTVGYFIQRVSLKYILIQYSLFFFMKSNEALSCVKFIFRFFFKRCFVYAFINPVCLWCHLKLFATLHEFIRLPPKTAHLNIQSSQT